jgi:hypothetical protein
VAQRVIQSTQSAFLPGRNIMEGVVILHETIHELHRKKESGGILKIERQSQMALCETSIENEGIFE